VYSTQILEFCFLKFGVKFYLHCPMIENMPKTKSFSDFDIERCFGICKYRSIDIRKPIRLYYKLVGLLFFEFSFLMKSFLIFICTCISAIPRIKYLTAESAVKNTSGILISRLLSIFCILPFRMTTVCYRFPFNSLSILLAII